VHVKYATIFDPLFPWHPCFIPQCSDRYNERREDFSTKEEWDNYLEMVEDISKRQIVRMFTPSVLNSLLSILASLEERLLQFTSNNHALFFSF
jgi:hypothetical protein